MGNLHGRHSLRQTLRGPADSASLDAFVRVQPFTLLLGQSAFLTLLFAGFVLDITDISFLNAVAGLTNADVEKGQNDQLSRACEYRGCYV